LSQARSACGKADSGGVDRAAAAGKARSEQPDSKLAVGDPLGPRDEKKCVVRGLRCGHRTLGNHRVIDRELSDVNPMGYRCMEYVGTSRLARTDCATSLVAVNRIKVPRPPSKRGFGKATKKRDSVRQDLK
jgi:hypothetical protein